MLVDEVEEIILKGGNGGNGRVSFCRPPQRGPDGGNGGNGGDVYVVTIDDIMALGQFAGKKEFVAGSGNPGDRNRKSGHSGEDIEIRVPVGTSFVDLDFGRSFELNHIGARILVSKGGKGGRGNYEFRSSTNTTPKTAELGEKGQKKRFKVVLRLLADYGLIGLPNAGKSSLLNELTRANVKTAAYAFTTLEPNLGVVGGKVIADNPGLIKGASKGRGLGIKFLKHIEKATLLLHCVSAESEDVVNDYGTIREELNNYNPALLEKREIVLLTKTDVVSDKELQKKIAMLKKQNRSVFPVSILDQESIDGLKKLLIEE